MAAPEATIYTYGLYNPAPAIAYTIHATALHAGYLVKKSTTAGQMILTTACTDIPQGYLIKSTVPPTMQEIVNMTGATMGLEDQFIGVQALIPGQEAYLMACTTDAITIGDYVSATTYSPASLNGTVVPRTATNKAFATCLIGVALEARAANFSTVTPMKVRIMAPVYVESGEVPT
jgi:hypothetical protein